MAARKQNTTVKKKQSRASKRQKEEEKCAKSKKTRSADSSAKSSKCVTSTAAKKMVKTIKKEQKKATGTDIYEFLLCPITQNISIFIDRLKGLRTKREIRVVCEKEKRLLEQAYPNLTTRHGKYTQYRKEIRTQYGHKRGKLIHDYALELMKLDTDTEQHKRNEMCDINRSKRNTQQATFDLREFVKECREAIDNRSNPLMALGLMGSTGRRPIEILKTAKFEYINNKSVRFRGQAKTKIQGDDQNETEFTIPVLGDALKVIDALNYIRKVLPLHDTPNEIINGRETRKMLDIAHIFLKKFKKTERIPLDNKSLRKMYAAACYELNDIRDQTRTAYYSDILCHTDLDDDSAQNYTCIRIREEERDIETYRYRDLL